MYGYDYAYEPATEGLAEIGNWITEKLNAGKEMIKKLIDDVKEKLRRMSGKKENVGTNTSEVQRLIGEITAETNTIITGTGNAIDALKTAYLQVAKLTTETKRFTGNSADEDRHNYQKSLQKKGAVNVQNTAADQYGDQDYRYATYTKGGIKNIRDDLTTAEKEEWQKAQQEQGAIFNTQMEAAEKVKAKLKKLSTYGPLSYDATLAGYNDLRTVFGTNQTVINKWQNIKTAVDWSQGSGQLHKSLKKIMSLYDVGMKATEAFGKRLSSGKYRDANGEKFDRDEIKARNARNKADMALRKSAKGSFAKDMSGWSDAPESVGYILDRLYQVAYEDAIQDIDTCNYYQGVYESVPECDAYDYDEDAEYYPDEYYDY